MPLSPGPNPCDAEDCDNDTYYYKEVFIPYSEGIPIGELRTAKGIKGRVHLCPVHYHMNNTGTLTLHVTSKTTYGTKDRDF